jgi:hypothetical protein
MWQGLADEFQTFEDSQPDKDSRAKVNALGQLLDNHKPDEKLS